MFLDYLLDWWTNFISYALFILTYFHLLLMQIWNWIICYFPFFLRANDYLEYNKNEINYERRTCLTFYIN